MKTIFSPGALALAAMAVLGFAGCTLPSGAPLVDRRSANQLQRVQFGTVEQARPVTIGGSRSQIGTLGGAAVGHAAATDVGHGAGNELARAGGAVVGAVTGDAVEEAVTRTGGQELTIKLDDGSTAVISQEAPPQFSPGDRVRLLVGGGTTRVTAP
jgi:outer membrane lipoprotein SlyB